METLSQRLFDLLPELLLDRYSLGFPPEVGIRSGLMLLNSV